MDSQVIFKVDSATKARAMKRAKREGVPFASVLKHATRAFADGYLSMELVEQVRPEKLKLWERESRLLDEGKGRKFQSLKEFRKYLKTL